MRLGDQEWDLQPIAKYIFRGTIEPSRLPALAHAVKDEGGQLLALWGSDERHYQQTFGLHCAFITPAGLAWVSCPLPSDSPEYPAISHIFPQADRMQRATFDLFGLKADGAVDTRKWLRHGAWPEDVFPLRKDFDPSQPATEHTDAYSFIRVAGDGVHEIPVGPIHAGTIEPGHFRFSIIGDRILKLEQRLGYTHKGTEKRFEGLDLATGAKLAGRVSGDSHSAFTYAYCMAVEQALDHAPPPRAQWLRALFLEIERIANHLGDLGYLGNDVALSFGFMQFWQLKEEWLRLTARLFGHRYLFDRIVPGGVTTDIDDAGKARLLEMTTRLKSDVKALKRIYDEHAGLQDRFATTGICTAEMATKLGLTGMAGRASGQARDARVQFPQPPYDQLKVNISTRQRGDVLARSEVRFAEVFESLRLIQEILGQLPAGDIQHPLPAVKTSCEGLGWLEGWRGEVLVSVKIGAEGKLERVHPHDPSWQNWPLLEVGVLGNIVPDFPLINKSFNLSYSGQDL
jgi:Ni,Fe-hydrogenase III large subunit/Ni,Fe-hydrogenase III component G